MQCEQCRSPLDQSHLCEACGRTALSERIQFREKLPPVLFGWREGGLVTEETFLGLTRQVHLELRALKNLARSRAPVPTSGSRAIALPQPPEAPQPEVAEPVAPKPEVCAEPPAPLRLRQSAPPARPFELPAAPRGRRHSFAAVGGFLRERTGWVTGVVLTVVGSFYLAGTVWSDLSALWRALVVVAFLAMYTLGFTFLGSRLGRIDSARRAGRWLLGVAAALAPVHAMATAGLWDRSPAVALAALGGVVVLHHLLLRRTFGVLLPGDNRVLRFCYLGLSAGVGIIPAISGPGWLLVPALVALIGLWATLTRYRGLPGAAAGLLAHAMAFHLYLTPAGPASLYAPAVALAALAVLYVDVALARFRGLHGVRTRGLRGVLAAVLAGVAVVLVLPNFQFLPVGYESALTGLFLAAFFLAAALGWRRPTLWYGGLAGLLLFTLSVPDLARVVVTPLLAAAGTALGYESEPLPLAWYSLTLLPYLLASLVIRWRLGRAPWRQGRDLAEVTFRWSLGLCAILLVVAHTKGSDLRPALFAIPAYALIWLSQRRVRELAAGVLPALAWVLWSTDLLLQIDAAPDVRLVVGAVGVVTLIPVARWLAGRVGEPPLARGALWVAVLAAAVLPWVLGGVAEPVVGLVCAGAGLWVVSFQLREARDTTAVQAAGEAVLATAGQILLVTGAVVHGVHVGWSPETWAWLALAGSLAAAAAAWSLPRLRVSVKMQSLGLAAWAHLLFVVVVLAMAPTSGLSRLGLDLGLVALMVHWLWTTRSRAHGALLVSALVFKGLHQLWAHTDVGTPELATAAVVLAWIPAGVLLGWRRRLPARVAWLTRALGEPAGWIGLAASAAALILLVPTGLTSVSLGGAALILVGSILVATRIVERLPRAMELYGWLAAVALATSLAVAGDGWPARIALALAPVGLAVLLGRRPGREREIAWLAAVACAATAGMLGGALEHLDLLSGVMVGVTLRAAGRHPSQLGLPGVGATVGARQPIVGWPEAVLLGWTFLAVLASQHVVAEHPSVQLTVLAVVAACLWPAQQWHHVRPRWARAASRVSLWLVVAGAVLWTAECARLAFAEQLGWAPAGLWVTAALALLVRLPIVARLLAPWAICATLLALGAPWIAHPLALLALALILIRVPGQGRLREPYIQILVGLAALGLSLAPLPAPWMVWLPLLAWPAAAWAWMSVGKANHWMVAAMVAAPLALLAPGSVVELAPRLVDGAPAAFALLSAVIGFGWYSRGERAAALWQLFVAAEVLALWYPGLSSGVPAAVALGAAAASRLLGHRRLALALHWLVAVACLFPASGPQLVVFALATAASVAHTWRSGRPAQWYLSLSWAGALYALLRLTGPLQHLDARDDLYALVGLAVALEVAVVLLRPRGHAFVGPLRQAAAVLPLVGVGLAVFGPGLTVPGLTAAGAVFCLRYVFRTHWADLAAGLVLLDAASLLLVAQQGWSQPLAFVAPVGLSVLVAAQLLRSTLDPRVVTLMRYCAAAALYLAALMDAVGTPMWSLVLLQMSLLGMAAGAVLRVRAFLFLGSGFAAAALLTELLRFGLAHSQFWALYLTVLGLFILGSMVLLTLWRQPLTQLRRRFVQVMGEWE